MTENQPTIAEPVDPTASATGATETPGAGQQSSSGTSYGPPPPYAPPPFPPQKPALRRSRSDRVLTGVCGGLAENLGIDAVLIRILVVVGTVFTGGALIIAYVIAWALMPDTPLYPVAVYAQPGAPASFAAGGTGTYVDPATGAVYGAPTPVAPQPRTEPRSYLGLVTLSAAIVVGGLLALVGSLGASISGLVVSASLLLVFGVGLLVGAWRGRARWLIAPALILVLFVQAAAAVQNVVDTTGSGAGDRTWTPTSASETYSLGAGSATLDLRQLPSGPVDLTVQIGAGELIVLVPAGTEVQVDGSIGAGQFDFPDQDPQSGVGLSFTQNMSSLGGTPTVTTVDLSTEIGLGNLEVRRATS
jgi:phage shock protein PspC (stress-responsive transcriptional regulator)